MGSQNMAAMLRLYHMKSFKLGNQTALPSGMIRLRLVTLVGEMCRNFTLKPRSQIIFPFSPCVDAAGLRAVRLQEQIGDAVQFVLQSSDLLILLGYVLSQFVDLLP